MAHNIMNNRNMAYNQANGVPWHGLGTAISDPSDIIRCQREAGLDWEVTVSPAYYRDPESGKGTKAEGYSFVLGPDGTIFQAVTGRYQAIQNSDIIQLFDDYCKAGKMTIETLGALGNGNVIWCLAKYSDEYKVGNDIHQDYALLTSSHDGSIAFLAKLTNIRVVCQNTLSFSLRAEGNTHKIKHTTNWKDKVGGMKDLFKIYSQTSDSVRAKLNDYGELVLDESEIPVVSDLVTRFKGRVVLDAILRSEQKSVSSEYILDSIIENMSIDADVKKTIGDPDSMNRLGKAIVQTWYEDSTMPEEKDTAYGMVQAVTRHLDHYAGRGTDSRLQSSWYGSYANIKDTTVTVLDRILAVS